MDINQDQFEGQNKLKNSFLQKPIIPQRSTQDFYLNSFLSDAILKTETFEIPFHKIIISSASDFFYDYFKALKSEEILQKIEVKLPEKIKSELSSEYNEKEILEKIFKYCYNNQNIDSIKENITKNNIFNYVELAHCLQIKSLKDNLEKIIIKNFLDEDNIIKICEESQKYELNEVKKVCKENIIKNLGNIKNAKDELTNINYDTFKEIISSDEIDTENEKNICDLVIGYIKFRRNIPEEKEEIKENINININNNEINNENEKPEENKENIEENKENNEENKENNEENKENEEQKEEEIKVNIKNNIEEEDPYILWKKKLEEIKKNLKQKRLTSEQEKDLVSCIRFSFLSHADLIALNNEPLMDNFKDLIMQGLSARLDTYENADEKNVVINLKPRNYLRQKKEIKNEINNEINYNMNMINNNNNEQIKIEEKERKMNDYNINKFNDPRNFAYSQQIKKNNFNFIENDTSSINNKNNNDINNNEELDFDNNNFNDSNSNYFEGENINKDINNINQNYLNENINSNRYKSRLQGPIPISPQDPKISKNYFNQKNIISTPPPPIFKYTYDFDQNGALYYLGTLGKKNIYRNPHELNLVTVFASSLSKGELSDFVGRNLVNLRTENEEFSYFGVDLGKNRKLLPSAYSLRNRNSSTHVLLCWELEGSNDKINFEILDTRIFWSENYDMNKKLERERNLLIEPGCTSTWGISKKIREKYPDGFRYFLIKQIDKNSNGSYNLTNSGFELYGEAKGNGWFFN